MNEIECFCCEAVGKAPHYEVFLPPCPFKTAWLVFAVLLLIFFLICWKWRAIKKCVTLTCLGWLALLAFLLGVFVYTIGSLQSDEMGLWDAIYTVPSAVISSLGMFIYQDDISELTDEVKKDSMFMGLYSIAHFLAALITSFFLIRLIGMRVFYWIELQRESWFPCKGKKDLYLFYGINQQSVTLAESIYRDAPKGKRIVFVNVTESEDEGREVSIHSLFDVIKVKEEANERISDIEAIIVNCHASLTNKEAAALASGGMTCKMDLFTLIGRGARLRCLARLMRKKSSNIHIFFLSNDMDSNINNMEALLDVDMPADEDMKVHIYCHARHSAKTRWAEIKDVCTYGKNPRIHIVDSSYLSVFSLKNNVAHHPVSFVEVDKNSATVSTPFRSMVIGFGETGEEAFKFLYEFGAFVDCNGEKTAFHCTVIDQKTSELEGLFYAKAPSMRDVKDKELSFRECSINSTAYWDLIEDEVRRGLNYIVVAMSDEELAIDTAVNICTLATRWRDDDASKLSVYLRSYRADNYKRMVRIASELNDKCGGIQLEIFGGMAEIFNYEVIVDNKYIRQAKKYHLVYDCVSEGKIVAEITDDMADDKWNELHRLEPLDELKERYKFPHPDGHDIWNVEEVERKRDQNISNALHAMTKWQLLTGNAPVPAKKEEKNDRAEKRKYWTEKDLRRKMICDDSKKEGEWGYKVWTPEYMRTTENGRSALSDQDVTILLNVARCEHERWRAASRLQGQRLAPQKTRRYKQHTDLVKWEDLRPSDKIDKKRTQGYDCAVVDTTILHFYKDTSSKQ